MKVSFDFDSTLSRDSVRKLAKQFIAQGYEVHIVTSRFEDSTRWGNTSANLAWAGNRDLFRATDHLGIKRENIHFMNMDDKYKFFQENPGFIFHIDDDKEELAGMTYYTPEVKTIYCSYNNDDWKVQLEEILANKGSE